MTGIGVFINRHPFLTFVMFSEALVCATAVAMKKKKDHKCERYTYSSPYINYRNNDCSDSKKVN